MHLSKLQVSNFRNYENQYFEFSDGLNCVVGVNGSGKTNLLDAIYFLALCKSSIHNLDSNSIKFDADYMRIEGVFESKDKERITCTLPRIGKKVFSVDDSPYEKLNEHIGKYQVVLMAPDDTDIIRDGAETRRKLWDGILAQLYPAYLSNFLQYNKALDQRNSLLKQFAMQNYFDQDLINIYSDQILILGKKIHADRQKFILQFVPIFKNHFELLSDHKEAVEINYNSELSDDNFEEIFKKNIGQDMAAQRTTKGVHKDDYEFILDQKPLKKFGSQGQRKSFVMALKMAQFEIFTDNKNTKPLLLLDDIFDKLDENRISKLIEMINNGVFGQVFLTDARPNRTKQLLKDVKVNFVEMV